MTESDLHFTKVILLPVWKTSWAGAGVSSKIGGSETRSESTAIVQMRSHKGFELG